LPQFNEAVQSSPLGKAFLLADAGQITGKPEVIGSSTGLVPPNALVLTGLATFRTVGKPGIILGPDLSGG
jgi:hypothetical protein